MTPYILDPPCIKQWKNVMKDEVMQNILKVKKPTRRELITKSYPELKLDDIEFVIDYNLEHDEISQMDVIRYRFKPEKVPTFKTEKARNAYLKKQALEKIQEEIEQKRYLKIKQDDTPAFQRWKKSYK